MKLVGLGVVGVVMLASTSALAVDVGTVAVSGSFGASANAFEGNASGSSKGASVTVLPSVDVIVGRGWSLGVSAPIVWQQSSNQATNGRTTEFSTTAVQPGLQVGYYIPIGEWAAIWPVARASYGVGWLHQDDGTTTSDPKSRILEASLTPQVLILPTKSFFLRFSPGALSYRHTKWEGQAQGGAWLLGVSPSFSMGIGVML